MYYHETLLSLLVFRVYNIVKGLPLYRISPQNFCSHVATRLVSDKQSFVGIEALQQMIRCNC